MSIKVMFTKYNNIVINKENIKALYTEKFDQNNTEHISLLKSIWRGLKGTEEFNLKSPKWRKILFIYLKVIFAFIINIFIIFKYYIQVIQFYQTIYIIYIIYYNIDNSLSMLLFFIYLQVRWRFIIIKIKFVRRMNTFFCLLCYFSDAADWSSRRRQTNRGLLF